MFGMSFADVFASSAMALITTLPMPRNDDPVWFKIERWVAGGIKWEDQTKLGNMQTCEAQAFFYSTCVTIMFAYNGMLCIYYACAIAFRMRDEKTRKKVEPFIHIVPLGAGLSNAIPSFLNGYYGPIDNEACCTRMRPGSRTKEDAVSAFVAIQLPICICVLFFVIIASFGALFWRVRKNGKELRRAETKIDGDQSQIVERAQAAHRNSKLIIVQSFAYAAAFLLTLTFPLIRTFMFTIDWTSQNSQTYAVFGKLMLTFMPLQGFLNFIIFLSHKGKDSICNSSELILFGSPSSYAYINAPFISCELPHRTPRCVCMPSYQTPFWKLYFRTSIIFEAVNGSHEREYARG